MEKIYVTKSSLPKLKEYVNVIEELFETRQITNNGKLHNKLENKIKKYLNNDNFMLFANGHLALESAIKALDLTGEVITTPFTFASTTHAIMRNGLTPVFCDINYDDYTIDAGKIESLITDKTSAIIPVHVYGNICDVEKIEKIAKKHSLKVIYDAAHAFGEIYKGKNVASFGDASMFSFHATKVFNTIEGGGLAYKDKNLTSKLKTIKNFGIEDDTIKEIGFNAKMNEFEAAMGLCNFKHLKTYINKREKIYNMYLDLLKDIKGIKLNKINNNIISNYSYFPILIEDEYGITRDELFDILKSHNIYARKYFSPAINDTECYKKFLSKTPIAHDISNKILTLPLYPDLLKKDVIRICKIIKNRG